MTQTNNNMPKSKSKRTAKSGKPRAGRKSSYDSKWTKTQIALAILVGNIMDATKEHNKDNEKYRLNVYKTCVNALYEHFDSRYENYLHQNKKTGKIAFGEIDKIISDAAEMLYEGGGPDFAEEENENEEEENTETDDDDDDEGGRKGGRGRRSRSLEALADEFDADVSPRKRSKA